MCELEGLGGGGDEDLEEGILTLPAALAIEHSARVRALFSKRDRSADELATLRAAFIAQLPRAAQELDDIRRQLESELAHLGVRNAPQFQRLIGHVRRLAPAADAVFSA